MYGIVQGLKYDVYNSSATQKGVVAKEIAV